MKSKLRVAVLMGGPSAEHDVSLKTGAMVAQALDRRKYDVTVITVSRRGTWPLPIRKVKRRFDLVFNAMHGEYGEDGTLQQLLDKHHIFFTGSGARASALGMDKQKSYRLFTRAGLRVPPYRAFRNGKIRLSADRQINVFSGAIVVKPADRGSSVGVTIVKKPKEFAPALRRAFKTSERIIIQKFIPGREITCGVLEVRGKTRALPPTEIIPRNHAFFDYHEKYASTGAREITPARIGKTAIRSIQRAALRAHRAIGAAGYSRSDFIIEKSKSSAEGGSPPAEIRRAGASGGKEKIYILEINTLPGLTAASLLPKAARAAGISFPRLLDYIIASARR